LRQAEDRAFATLDALTTQELGSELSDQAPPTAVKPLAATSGRQPVPAKAVAASRISGRRRKA
jgi:hypothetical protein